MSNETRRPVGLRERSDRFSSKILGGLTILMGLGLISKLIMWEMVGGAIMLYGGLIMFPMTRKKVTLGKLGFTKWRRISAHLIWMGLWVLGFMIAQPGA